MLCNNKSMNQILDIFKNRKKIIKILKIQLLCSILGILAIIILFKRTSPSTKKTENYSKSILVNQKLTSIYKTEKLENEIVEENSNIFCSIEIPKINIVYPVFNTFSEELLDLSPCKFSGPNLNEFGNIAIAGHNLENHTFFSDLSQVELNDIINIYSNSGEKFEYIVYKTYETESDDLTTLANSFINQKELTLVTCNNTNKKRFIVKALLNE